MLVKLSLNSIKSRFKDYLVLFFGLIISSAIFYMFEAIATNNQFTEGNTIISSIKFIFQFGSILLGIITLVYVSYANNFLVGMRKHDYGLFMMLGAKKGKVSQLVAIETMFVGIISTILGIILGISLTGVLSKLIMKQLGISLKHFSVIYFPAIKITLILFIILFLIASILNIITFSRTSALTLLRSSQATDWKKASNLKLIIQSILGLILLGIGYFALCDIKNLKLSSIPIALVTIVLGTYFVFNALVSILITQLQKTNFGQKRLNNFTLAQLKFRIRDYTKILSVVSILFALSLGAITVSYEMNHQVEKYANVNSMYSIAVVNPDKNIKTNIQKLSDASVQQYDQITTKNRIYYNKSQINARPFEYQDVNNSGEIKGIKKASIRELSNPNSTAYSNFLNVNGYSSKKIIFVSDQKFNSIHQKVNHLTLVKVKHTTENNIILDKIVAMQSKQLKVRNVEDLPGSYGYFKLLKGVYSGMEFMGTFLGFAFLAMLASCLMFKILSGATDDRQRYQMINKLGAQKSTQINSIIQQVGLLFLLPAILGIIDVIFGLQMFDQMELISDPYSDLILVLCGFLFVYLLYGLVTVIMYIKIVLPKIKITK